MSKIKKINGAIQRYAWGGKEFISELTGQPNPDNHPMAELWMGTHPKGPSYIKVNGEKKKLSDYIASKPEEILGANTSGSFDQKLPFLFKVLDVNEMLSIQTHPTRKTAKIGFEKENELGIALDAFDRTFRDDNHKPEVMVALTDFYLLHGFKEEGAIKELLGSVPEFSSLKIIFERGGLKGMYKYIMTMSQSLVNAMLEPLVERLHQNAEQYTKSHAEYWVLKAVETHSQGNLLDRGIFSIFLFNLVNLKVGEGIFQAAGIPHAYLEGVNVELMANSDNVFRGGLTKKFMNVPELMKNMVFESVKPNILTGTQNSASLKSFPTEAKDFELFEINIPENKTTENLVFDSISILLLISGEVSIKDDSDEQLFKKGNVILIPSNTRFQISSHAESHFFGARVPLN